MVTKVSIFVLNIGVLTSSDKQSFANTSDILFISSFFLSQPNLSFLEENLSKASSTFYVHRTYKPISAI